jgi:integrase
LKIYFEFVGLRHKVEIHNVTGRVVECPIDEMNRPRVRRAARGRISPTAEQVEQLFAGCRGELTTCRTFGPTARNYAAARVGSEVLRAGLAEAAAGHLPGWSGKLTPHVLRHFCASQLYFTGMDLIVIQETLGHAWIATTMNYVHVHRTQSTPGVMAPWLEYRCP